MWLLRSLAVHVLTAGCWSDRKCNRKDLCRAADGTAVCRHQRNPNSQVLVPISIHPQVRPRSVSKERLVLVVHVVFRRLFPCPGHMASSERNGQHSRTNRATACSLAVITTYEQQTNAQTHHGKLCVVVCVAVLMPLLTMLPSQLCSLHDLISSSVPFCHVLSRWHS